MILRSNFFLTITIFAFGYCFFLEARELKVRVLIDDQKKSARWTLSAPDGFIISNPIAKQKERFCKTDVTIVGDEHAAKIQGTSLAGTHLICKARKGGKITCNGKPYKGTFHIKVVKEKVYLINYIALDEYLHAVVHSESWPGWPLEVNKAFAIASRSYVMAMMRRAKMQGLPYHVRDDNNHQRYNLYGTEVSPLIEQAVKSTSGMLLVYNDEPIIAMFDACCGGVIPAHIQDFNFQKAPYLARKYACHYCKECRSYAWKVEHDRAELERLFQKANIPARTIRSMLVSQKDKAGIVLRVQVKDAHNKHHHIEGKRIYSLLDGVKSFSYGISMKSGKITFSGHGLGHHLGMCQWGARQMVKEGFSFKQILSFYYPGAQIKKLG